MKTLFWAGTVICAGFSLLVQTAQAQFTYTNNGDGTATITSYTGNGGVVTIPTNINGLLVTGFGDNVFTGLANLTSVSIPGSVSSIGAQAFASCTSLTNITIPNGISNIGQQAFQNCPSLTSITIPESVTSIGEYAFQSTGLTSVAIPDRVSSIGDYAFRDCTGLTNVIISNAVIGNYEFAETGLTSITIPNSVTSIGGSAFWFCTSLTNAIIPNSVTNIVGTTFYFCTNLTAITVNPGNSIYCSSGGVLFDKSQTTLLEYPPGLVENYTVPDSVTGIGTQAFQACPGLTSVTIPPSVTNLGYGAFDSCYNLTSVTIPASITNLAEWAIDSCVNLTSVFFLGNAPTVDSTVFAYDNKATVYYLPDTTGWSVFARNSGCPVVVLNSFAPLISAQPQSVEVNAYDTTTFSVSVSGITPLNYQWLLNGTNVAGATSSSLSILKVVQTNLGTYSVFVTNAFGSVTSSSATLTMYPFIPNPFTGAVAYWGQNAAISVQAWGTGPLSYQWFDNGNPITDATNDTFTLTGVQFTNAGIYSVVVSSPFGSATNPPAQMVVEPAGVSLGFSPTLTISGVAGHSYIIQSAPNLTDTNAWVTLTNLTLTQPVQLWVDTNVDASSPSNPRYFYRVLPGQ